MFRVLVPGPLDHLRHRLYGRRHDPSLDKHLPAHHEYRKVARRSLDCRQIGL